VFGIRLPSRVGHGSFDAELRRRAVIAGARKLAVILHRMWIDGSEFRWGAVATPHEAYQHQVRVLK
jgi:hypothetical protein